MSNKNELAMRMTEAVAILETQRRFGSRALDALEIKTIANDCRLVADLITQEFDTKLKSRTISSKG